MRNKVSYLSVWKQDGNNHVGTLALDKQGPTRLLPTTNMAPKAKTSTENMKQKSLMGWFAKSPADKPKATPKAPNASRSKAVANPVTPESKKPDVRALSSSVAASSTSSLGRGSNANDTPPTSDPIDVDMEDEHITARAKSVSTVYVMRGLLPILQAGKAQDCSGGFRRGDAAFLDYAWVEFQLGFIAAEE